MVLDIKTLFVANALVAVFMGCALAFFRATQKTYPGFGYWTLATLIIPLCYLFFLLRGFVSDLISIVLANAGFALASVFLLEGSRRFLKRPAIPRAYYLLPVFVLLACAHFKYVQDSAVWRNASVTTVIFFMSWANGWEFLAMTHFQSRRLYKTLAVILFLYGALVLARAVVLFTLPSYSLMDPTPVQTIYFLVVTVFQLSWGMGIIMMNSHRLTEELLGTQANLNRTVSTLERTLAEVKILSGLLPICAGCKKIRNDQGYWQQIEGYIQEHSQAQFSHGLCPECAKRLYPELLDDHG